MIQHSLGLLRNIAGVDEYKRRLVTDGLIPPVLMTMKQHAHDVHIQSMACALIAAICLRMPLNCDALVIQSQAHILIAHAMEAFPAHTNLLR